MSGPTVPKDEASIKRVTTNLQDALHSVQEDSQNKPTSLPCDKSTLNEPPEKPLFHSPVQKSAQRSTALEKPVQDSALKKSELLPIDKPVCTLPIPPPPPPLPSPDVRESIHGHLVQSGDTNINNETYLDDFAPTGTSTMKPVKVTSPEDTVCI